MDYCEVGNVWIFTAIFPKLHDAEKNPKIFRVYTDFSVSTTVHKSQIFTIIQTSNQKALKSRVEFIWNIFFFNYRARRTAEAERDDLQEEINSSAGKGSLHSDEKRRKAIIK